MSAPNELTDEQMANFGKQPPAGVPTRANNTASGLGSVSTVSPEELTDEQVAQYGLPQASAHPNPEPQAAPAREMSDEEITNFGASPKEQSIWSKARNIGEKISHDSPIAEKIDKEMNISIAHPAMGPVKALSIPIRAGTAGALWAADALNFPFGKELNNRLNPNREVLPAALPSDISDFLVDKGAEASGVLDQQGVLGDIMRMGLATGKGAVSLGMLYYTDPLNLMKFGQLTKEAEAIRKMGGTVVNEADVARGAQPVIDATGLNSPAANEKNLMSLKVPHTDVGFDIKGDPVQKYISELSKSPPIKTLSKVIQAFSPYTGDPRLDNEIILHRNLRRADPSDLLARFSGPKDALRMTNDEDRLSGALIEATPNLTPPGLPEDILKAAEKRTPGKPFWNNEDELRRNMSVMIESRAKKMGIEIAPGREQAIIESALMSKRMAAENNLDRWMAGKINVENAHEKIMENYLPHTLDPSYDGTLTDEEYRKRLERDEQSVNKTVGNTFVSSTDPTRQRKILGTLEEKNAGREVMDAQTFITDPVKSNVVNLLKSKKLLRDSQLMGVVKEYGERMSRGEASKAGYIPIVHPELEGMKVIKDGKTINVQDLYYPKEIASKIQSQIAPPALTGIMGTLKNYNRVFRNIVISSSPGIKFGNTLDNDVKAIALSRDFMESRKQAVAAMFGKSEGLRSEPTPAYPQGVFYDGQRMKEMVDKYAGGEGAYREGMGEMLNSGKKITFKKWLAEPMAKTLPGAWDIWKTMFKWADKFGEQGEKLARATLFVDRLRSGYGPEQAAAEVTRWMFDYGHNSPATEALRAWMPFVQHPLKTALIAPKLAATNPAAYNFISNTFPTVLANAMHDPITQQELNTILPEPIKQRDAILGPLIPGNTWVASIFGKPGSKIGSVPWFDLRIGLRILNHFDYSQKRASQKFLGQTSPLVQGLVGAALGRGDFDQSLDFANSNISISNRVKFLVGKIVGGVAPFPNAEKLILQNIGVVEPNYIEPNTVLVLRGMTGQFGSVTDLDRDFTVKTISLAHAFADQEKQMKDALRKEQSGNTNTFQKYINKNYPVLNPMSPAEVFKQLQVTKQEAQEAGLGRSALGGGMTLGDFAVRMKGISEEIKKANLAYQLAATRRLQMSNSK